jgi:tetratricopeptide (TPR) repeat protein
MKIFLALILSLIISINANAAGSDDSSNYAPKPKSFKEAVSLIKSGKYNDAVEALETILKNKKNSKNPDILNEYAFALRKSGNLGKAETFYNKALNIDPNHKGALEYIGELYVDTKRMDKAKQTLTKLENCKCPEYAELKSYIDQAN